MMLTDDDVSECPACGAEGRICKGPSEDGPEYDNWIGQTNGKPCCHVCWDDTKER